MKKLIVILTFIVPVSLASFGQGINSSPTPMTKQLYLQKSKVQKVSGLLLLAGGVTGIAIVSKGNTDMNSIAGIVGMSGAAIIGSIPLLIASGKNKRKARSSSVSLDVEMKEKLLQSNSKSFNNQQMKIAFRKFL